MKKTNKYSHISSQHKHFRLILQNLRSYNLSRRGMHESIFSQQSSDIVPFQEVNLDKTFKSSKEQISGIALYQDLSANLLKSAMTQSEHTQFNIINGKNYVIFDSIAIDAELKDRQIQAQRDNKELKQQIKYYHKVKALRQQQLFNLIAINEGYQNIQKLVNSQYEKLDLDIQTTQSLLDQRQWYIGTDANTKRKQAISIVEKGYRTNLNKVQIQIQDLQDKKRALQQNQQNLLRRIEQIQKQIYENRHRRKENLTRQTIRKQKQTIAQLQKTIEKMRNILQQSKRKNSGQ